ncbi:MAG: peptide chain release factor 3 [Elusimicrobia bacterium]|nr:peptide chain release factor 3 [Elusimicrobiota bacterium]
MNDLEKEISKRRTLAIISHPDAGKTTLTEKLLLYGGAMQLAGAVTARRKEQATASDWMEIERQRGISVNSTVLQFDYAGFRINLLDTPGHKDFSEDTYRVLMAVDSVIMILDAAKGIESQTLKLFEICRLRQIPIYTFINKMDRPAQEPLALLDEIEKALQIHVCPMNWPLGDGKGFRGVFDRRGKSLHLFERVPGGAYRAPVTAVDIHDKSLDSLVDAQLLHKFRDELSMLDAAAAPFNEEEVQAGDLTPVFFGSAMNNFGVQLMLDGFLALSRPPRAQKTLSGPIQAADPRFSGFIFKIQSNMDPKHRDQIAFLRICSGKFERDMRVLHKRTGKTVRLASSHKVLGRERETMDEAYAGDVIGIVGHSEFGIGDTLTQDPSIAYRQMPRFAPEHFAFPLCGDTAHFKRFRTGLEQLLQEGVVQTFALPGAPSGAPLLGAVGPLQFEVLKHRLESEYGASARLETAQWRLVRWIGKDSAPVEDAMLPTGSRLAKDAAGNQVALFTQDWDVKYFQDRNPKVVLNHLPLAEDGSPLSFN